MHTTNKGQIVPEGSPYARHLPALDGIRGFAVLGVACSHLFPANPHTAFESIGHKAFAFGASGVDLFFVLSGFLITGILYDSLPHPGFFRKFYARRALRIFPLYYGVLALFAVAALLLGLNFHHELVSLALYLQNSDRIAPRIRNYGGPTLLPLAHFWSLAIEEQFYLVWPVTVFLLRTRRRLLIVCAAALLLCPLLRFALLLHGVNYFVMASNTVCRADSLLTGAAIALLLRSRFHDRVLRAAGWIFIVGALAYIAMELLIAHVSVFEKSIAFQAELAFDFSALALTFAGVLVLALRSPLVAGTCSLPPMRWLGKYSYGIYVVHLILFIYLDEPLRGFMETHITPNKGANIVITGLLIFSLSLIAAYLSYHLYEKRFLRLKRFFDYRPHPNTVH
jgi:peptidoglycan/LPS O-acetylase OafA/YrhL